MLGDPGAGGERVDEGLVEATAGTEPVDVLQRGLATEVGLAQASAELAETPWIYGSATPSSPNSASKTVSVCSWMPTGPTANGLKSPRHEIGLKHERLRRR